MQSRPEQSAAGKKTHRLGEMRKLAMTKFSFEPY